MLDKMITRYKDRNEPPSLLVHVKASDLEPEVDEALPEILRWTLGRMSDLGIAVCSNGSFISSHTNQLVRRNSLICLLRRDYLQGEVGPLRGRALNRVLEATLQASLRATKKAEAYLPVMGKLEEVEIDFNKYEI